MIYSLHKLIKSFSKVEKRVFSKRYKMQSRSQDFLLLFDLLNKTQLQPLKSDDNLYEIELALFRLIRKKLGKPQNEVSRLKGELADKLFDYLIFSSDHPYKKIYSNLAITEDLRKKGNFTLAQICLWEAKELAWKVEALNAVEDIHVIEGKLPSHYQSKDYEAAKEQLVKIREENEGISILEDRFSNWVAEKNTSNPKIDFYKNLLANEMFSVGYEVSSKGGKARLILLKRQILSVQENWVEAKVYSSRYIQLVSSSAFFSLEKEELLLDELINFANLSIVLKEWDDFYETLNTIKFMGNKDGVLPIKATYQYLRVSLIYSVELGLYETGEQSKQYLLGLEPLFWRDMPIKSKLDLIYRLAIFSFIFGEYKECNRWIQRFYSSASNHKVYQFLYPFMAIMEILILLEKGEEITYEYKLRSFRRYLKNTNSKFAFFPNLLSNLKKAFNSYHQGDLTLLKKKVDTLEKLKADSFDYFPFQFFDAEIYLKSKVEGEVWGDYIRKIRLPQSSSYGRQKEA